MSTRGLTAVSIIAGLLLIAAVACTSPAASPAPDQTPPSTSEPATVVPTPSEPDVEPSAPATEPTVEPISPEEPTVKPITPDDDTTETATVSGSILYRERIALGPDATVEVKLADVSLADAPSTTIGEITIVDVGQVPIAFEIEYDPEVIDERYTYAIQAKIYERGELRFVTASHYPVLTRDSASHDLNIVLEMVASSEPVDTTPAGLAISVCMATEAVALPIEFEYNGTVPTGFDGINKANCNFTKDVETITITLTGPATHTEVFTLAEPTTAVSFPVPEGTISITTMEIVPAGEYERTITLTSVDGDTLVLSDEPGVLKTVTIVEAS
jgi:putative lipoprotein